MTIMKNPKYIDVKGLLTLRITSLLKKEHLCGDDLADLLKKNKKLNPGTIYPALKYLKENKLVKIKQQGRKKFYYLTRKGINENKIASRLIKKMFKKIIK